jgi:hypothetical protein
MRTAPARGRRATLSVVQDWNHPHLASAAFPVNQLVLTAAPASNRWRMKAISDGRAFALPGIFQTRLEALGACVLLAQQWRARVP